MEKVGDGQEGEEAPVTSPPLELRRPGSVGISLAGRGAAVPHSLHSPHDRATGKKLLIFGFIFFPDLKKYLKNENKKKSIEKQKVNIEK